MGNNENVGNSSLVSYQYPVVTDARYEVPRSSISLGCILGEGAFGVVRKAVLTSGGKQHLVAVKTLKGW